MMANAATQADKHPPTFKFQISFFSSALTKEKGERVGPRAFGSLPSSFLPYPEEREGEAQPHLIHRNLWKRRGKERAGGT